MKFEDKYISRTENALQPDPKKIELSDDAFALGEAIHELKEELDRVRSRWAAHT